MKSIVKASIQFLFGILLLAAQAYLAYQDGWYRDEIIMAVKFANPYELVLQWLLALVVLVLCVVFFVSFLSALTEEGKKTHPKQVLISTIASAVGAVFSLVQLVFSLLNISSTLSLYPVYTTTTTLLEAFCFVVFLFISISGYQTVKQ
jgi:hypothetical protein